MSAVVRCAQDFGGHRPPLQQEMKRSFDPAVLEMMDRDHPPTAELERDLEHIRQLNRWFGSYRLVSSFIRRWIKSADKLRVVDLATGCGDIRRLIVEYSRMFIARRRMGALGG